MGSTVSAPSFVKGNCPTKSEETESLQLRSLQKTARRKTTMASSIKKREEGLELEMLSFCRKSLWKRPTVKTNGLINSESTWIQLIAGCGRQKESTPLSVKYWNGVPIGITKYEMLIFYAIGVLLTEKTWFVQAPCRHESTPDSSTQPVKHGELPVLKSAVIFILGLHILCLSFHAAI